MARIVNKVLADLEERGTMRTAPEDFNLAVHSVPHDATNAEFIRTFQSIAFPGARFLERLELEQRLRSRQDVETRRLPPRRRVTGKDHVQDTPWVELYGFRGEHPDLYYLSPWEFMERWEALPLQPPCKRCDHNFTEWLPGGEEYYEEHKEDDPPAFLVPGTHYALDDRCILPREYVMLPDEPELRIFRHEWILRRRARPMVPSPERTPMPSDRRSRDDCAKLFSTYLRCWVLPRQHASAHVPHLADLDLPSAFLPAEPQRTKLRLTGKTPPPELAARSFHVAWREYIRGHVVSEHARQVIVNFMGACTSTSRGDKDSDAEETTKLETPDVPEMQVSLERVHALLHHRSETNDADRDDLTRPMTESLAQAVDVGERLWGGTEGGSAYVPYRLDASGHAPFQAPEDASRSRPKACPAARGQRPEPSSTRSTILYTKYNARRVEQ